MRGRRAEIAVDNWTPAIADALLPEGKAIRVTVADADLFLYRTGDRTFALDNRCTHMGGPLHRGVVRANGPQASVTCPVHGSIFWMVDGRVVRGPASRPQPVYETRVHEGMVEVRLSSADDSG